MALHGAIKEQSALPLSIKQLTPEWVTGALGIRYPGTIVTSFSVDGLIVGTASKARLNLEYAVDGNPSDLPSVMYVKGGFHGPEQMALAGAGYLRECVFYSHYAPKLGDLEVPRSYFAAADKQTGQAIMLLDDLTARQVHFGNATKPISPDIAASVLEWQARLHGKFWNVADTGEFEAWPGTIKQVMDTLLSPKYWSETISRELAQPVPEQMRDPTRVRQALEGMWRAFENRGPQTLIHGDAHLGNMYFLPDGSPGYLDWQSPLRGPWSDDVTYFLIGSLSIDDRRRNERELLRHYLECLGTFIQHEVPSFDPVWLAYRQQVMHGFMWVSTPASMQPDDIVGANVERFCAALDDLETLKALDIGSSRVSTGP